MQLKQTLHHYKQRATMKKKNNGNEIKQIKKTLKPTKLRSIEKSHPEHDVRTTLYGRFYDVIILK